MSRSKLCTGCVRRTTDPDSVPDLDTGPDPNPNPGCIAFFQIRSAAELGVTVSGSVEVDFPKVMQRLRRLRAQISPNDSAERFAKLGVDVFLVRFPINLDAHVGGGGKIKRGGRKGGRERGIGGS